MRESLVRRRPVARGRVLDVNVRTSWWNSCRHLDLTAAPTRLVAAVRIFWIQGFWRGLRVSSRLAERERIARELHDGLFQEIQALILTLDAVHPCVEEPIASILLSAIENSECALIRTREYIELLRRERPSGYLTEALERLAAQWATRHRIPCAFEVRGAPRPVFAEVGQTLIQVGAEALENVARHSGATKVTMLLSYTRQHLRMSITDNGSGIGLAAIAGGTSGFGLDGMRERADLIKSRLCIESRAGYTEVVITVAADSAYLWVAGRG